MTVGVVTLTEEQLGNIKKITFTWTSGDVAAGNATVTTTYPYSGVLLRAVTVPGGAPNVPDDNYDITLKDESGVDIAAGLLLNRSNTLTQWVTASMGAVAGDKLTFLVDNANSLKTGVCYVYIGLMPEMASATTEISDALYGTTGIAAFPAAAAPANNVSMAEVLRSIWGGLWGTAAGENGITTWPAAAAPANTVSIAEAISHISTVQLASVLANLGPSYNSSRYLAVSTDFTSATWNIFTTPTHEVFTVTGLVRMRMWIECTGNVGSVGDTATIAFGHEAATNAFIAATAEDTIDVGELWYAAAPATKAAAYSTAVMDYVVNGLDVGYEIGGEALNAGSLVFHCVWEPLNATGAVAAGLGGTL